MPEDSIVAVLHGTCPEGHEHESCCPLEALDSHLNRKHRCLRGMRIEPFSLRAPDMEGVCQAMYEVTHVDTTTWAEMQRRWFPPKEGDA